MSNSSINTPNAPASTNGVSPAGSTASPRKSSPLINNEATKKVKRNRRENFGMYMKTYSASFLTVGVIIPVVASLVAATLYLTLPNSPLPPLLGIQPDSQWYTLVYSSILTGILWLVAAFPYCYFSTARGANPRNYNLLRSRLHQLKASLNLKDYDDDAYEEIDEIKIVMDDAGFNHCSEHKREVLKEAYACCIDISRKLYKFSTGLPWIIGTGYSSAWALLHHAEEVMIEVADVETVVRGAKHDFLAIQDSQINGQDELLDDLVQAVTVLKPEALVYFKEHQPGKSSIALSQLVQILNKFNDQSSVSSLSGHTSNKNGADSDAQIKAEAAARVTLREVRSTLNDFRDKRWEGIVQQRSRLLTAIAVTGIVTHALLCITILTNAPPVAVAHQQFTAWTPVQAGIIAATMFYMVGAIAGLFVRFYYESQGGTSVDDFGLSTTRLIAIPLLSGLAGIGGVLVAEMFATLGGSVLIGSTSDKAIALSTLFSLDPRLLFTAAVFGITPNLVIKGLQQKAKEYETELQSSKAAET